MTDFWIAVILTAVVSLLTVSADWLASRLIFASKTLRRIQRIMQSGQSATDAWPQVKTEMGDFRTSQSGALAWGAELSTVAISMDFACLGLWLHDASIFPFFTRFNTETASYEIPVWLILLGMHLILLIASLALKHKHAETRGSLALDSIAEFPQGAWFSQNGWMMAGNTTGFLSLLTTMLIMVRAI